jgi:hypothetical protein
VSEVRETFNCPDAFRRRKEKAREEVKEGFVPSGKNVMEGHMFAYLPPITVAESMHGLHNNFVKR